MKSLKFALLFAAAFTGNQACAAVLLSPSAVTTVPSYDIFTIYAGGDVTLGAHDEVYGSIASTVATTVGANTRVVGNIITGSYTTIGANSIVGGGVLTGGEVTVGASSKVNGNLVSGAATTLGASDTVVGSITATDAASVGALSTVGGAIISGGATTLGADSKVGGSIKSGAAASIGAGSIVGGSVGAVGAVTVGAGGQTGPIVGLSGSPLPAGLTDAVAPLLSGVAQQIVDAKTGYTALAPDTLLSSALTSDQTLLAGIYSAASLTTTAGTTLTLDGQNKANQIFVFNIMDALTTGASSNVVLINAGANTTVVWNLGGFGSLGANSTFVGSIFASSYVTLGAETVLTGPSMTCGGIYSQSYVSIGAGALVGCPRKRPGVTINPDGSLSEGDVSQVPEPATYLMMIMGFGLLGTVMRRRANVRSVVAA